MADQICPAGMVLIKPDGAVHPDEPAFCIGKTEVTQEADDRFWAEKLKTGFELLIKLASGGTKRRTNPRAAPLKAEAAKQIVRKGVFGVEVRPVVPEAKLQPEKNMVVGPRKPAVMRTWQEARDVCAGLYPGGDLPTERQWENACGKGEYCTASGTLDYMEAIYRADGPADVDDPGADKRVNKQGVQDMTGNVREWTRGTFEDGQEVMRGGSWFDYFFVERELRADLRYFGSTPDFSSDHVGFRCAVSPQDSKK